MSRKALVLLVCCCDFRDGAERLMPSKSLGNAVIRAFPGLFRILRMCAPRRAAAVVRPRGREKSADRRRRILISRLLIIRAAVPRRKSPFPAYFKGFPAISPLIPPYPAFLKYPVSPQNHLAGEVISAVNDLFCRDFAHFGKVLSAGAPVFFCSRNPSVIVRSNSAFELSRHFAARMPLLEICDLFFVLLFHTLDICINRIKSGLNNILRPSNLFFASLNRQRCCVKSSYSSVACSRGTARTSFTHGNASFRIETA